jgi:hypothetical protein
MSRPEPFDQILEVLTATDHYATGDFPMDSFRVTAYILLDLLVCFPETILPGTEAVDFVHNDQTCSSAQH